jgi:hypothetical protein
MFKCSNSLKNEMTISKFLMDLIGVNATANATKAEVDLFAPNLLDDIMDAPSAATTNSATEKVDEVDLFADADFQSAPLQPEPKASSKTQVSFKLIILIHFFLSSQHLTIKKHYFISENKRSLFLLKDRKIVLVNSSFSFLQA